MVGCCEAKGSALEGVSNGRKVETMSMMDCLRETLSPTALAGLPQSSWPHGGRTAVSPVQLIPVSETSAPDSEGDDGLEDPGEISVVSLTSTVVTSFSSSCLAHNGARRKKEERFEDLLDAIVENYNEQEEILATAEPIRFKALNPNLRSLSFVV